MKRWLYAIVPLLILSTLVTMRLKENKAAVVVQQQQRQLRMTAAPVVSVTPVIVRDIIHHFTGVGTVEAPMDVHVAAKVTGRVEDLQLLPGDHVSQGQILVRLDPSEEQATVAQQRAALEEAKFRLAQAVATQKPNDVQVTTQIAQQNAAVYSSIANYNQVKQNVNEQIAAAEGAVTDAQAKIDSADATIENMNAAIRSAQANVANAEAQYKRTHNLFTQGYVAAQDVDTASTAVMVENGALDVAKAELNAAQSALHSATVEKAEAQNQANIARAKTQSDLAAAKAQEDQARSSLEYARANIAQQPAYVQNLAALRSAVAAAEAQLNAAQVLQDDLVIRSPFDGYVTARNVDPGGVVSAGQAILSVRFIRQVWVTVPVPEETSRKIHEGQQATITLDAFPGQSFPGIITQIPPSADPQTRQIPVRITLDNSRAQIKPGMFARVSVVVDAAHNVAVVPPEAVIKGKAPGMPSTVTIVDSDSVAHRHSVVTGLTDADGVAVLQGLQPGDKVLTVSGVPIKDGQKVVVENSHPAGVQPSGA